MELNRRSPLCRLCLCCDDSFACIFEDKASDQYNISSLLVELLQLEVSENDGYPKHICLSCRKTVTDFKKFKQDCLNSMVTYDMEIRIPENGNIHQRFKGDEMDNRTITMGFLKQETNADDLDAFGNPLTKDECSLSDNELPSSIPGVDCDEIVHEPRVPKVKEDEDTTTEEVFAEEIPIEIVDHPIKIEPADSRDDEDATTESIVSLLSELNPESISTPLTELKQKEVNRITLNVNILNDGRRRTLDLESKSHESNGTTSMELFENVTSSNLDKSKEDEIECIQQGDSLIASEIQSGRMTTNEECHSFEEEEGDDVCWKLRNSDVKKEKENEGDGMSSHYNSDHCSKVFNDNSSLNMHLSLHERDVSIEGKEDNSTNAEVNENADNNTEKISHNCEVCRRSFKMKYNLKVHMRTHSDEKRYECDVCHQMFNHKDSRDRHVACVHENYRCSYCSKVFRVKNELAGHVQNCRKKKVFCCSRCDKCFDNNLSHNKHLRTHTTEKVFKCLYCNKCFSRRDLLSVHERIHTREKPFICSVCGKSFNYRSSSIVHMRIHTNDKRYKCGYCDKSFIRSDHLILHERTHTKEKPFRCSYCNKSFSVKSSVKQHERIHRGEKEFGCGICGKRFSQRSNLKEHERIHLQIKSFECNICKKSFCLKTYLKKHMKVHRK